MNLQSPHFHGFLRHFIGTEQIGTGTLLLQRHKAGDPHIHRGFRRIYRGPRGHPHPRVRKTRPQGHVRQSPRRDDPGEKGDRFFIDLLKAIESYLKIFIKIKWRCGIGNSRKGGQKLIKPCWYQQKWEEGQYGDPDTNPRKSVQNRFEYRWHSDFLIIHRSLKSLVTSRLESKSITGFSVGE